ncbi:MAG TPA: phenazine biosynthesis FMN-dependent oxidase PhzG [Solirubrobacterales bacterium]|nr:phenazine biosynthesis FMN-dependent oxidase PhzG [Solirubrobacterales bacterium]
MSEPVETLSGDPTLELPEFDAPPEEPLGLLERWLAAADERGVREPRALALATADAQGRPSTRIVLLKRANPAIVFAFSANSRKGRELAANPRAAGTLYWRETLQQIVFEGPVERLGAEESDQIFAERPPVGQATTVASNQGEVLDDPDGLRREAVELAEGGEALRRPEDWGGYRLDPDQVEFWHGSPDRLHRRLLYVKTGERWEHSRLQP